MNRNPFFYSSGFELQEVINMIEALILEPYHFKVRSANKRRYYDVIKRRDETYSCTCKSFKYNGTCKHIFAVEGL